MKKINIIIAVLVLIGTYTQAQVAIEKTTLSSASSLLEFNDPESGGVPKGIILPIVDNKNDAAEPGTLLLDATDDIVKYKNDTEWVNLTDASSTNYSSPDLVDGGEGAVISDGTVDLNEGEPAVLKLNSIEKAMILPRVSDVTTDIYNPEPGTIAYDKNSKSLAIFNGDYWFFWN